ncbi:MAG: DEAD/DEAH box helicase [Nanoarchaeota archaeon]|nr:DEAD/DEAH box helicase [Nanoarchaeota archaeon]
MSFQELQVHQNMINALKELGIIEPTLIQTKAIPLIKSGKDLIGISKTGSGKTAAFGIPILEKINPGLGLQVLMMAPTRELAYQISGELSKFSKYMPCRIATIFGGVSLIPQIEQIKKAHIVVGTPGRLRDHLDRGNLNLSKLTCLVLDEADKMVEMGFIEDIEDILRHTPKQRQMLLFGATISREIDHIKQRYMHDSVIAEAEAQVQKELLQQFYYSVKPHEKFSLLVHLLKKEPTSRVIVFCSKRSTVEMVSKNLRSQGIKSEIIHGKLSQNKRLHVIDSFNHGKLDFLVASAVAARGIHVDDVSHVFNYDLSQDPQEYIHRIGRTARAGSSGKAITLLEQRDHGIFAEILDRYKVDVQEMPQENFQRLQFQANNFRSRDTHQRFHGPRRNSYQRSDRRESNSNDGSYSQPRSNGRSREMSRTSRDYTQRRY